MNKTISQKINMNIDFLSQEIMNKQYRKQPEKISIYNATQKQHFLEDVKCNLNFLSAAISVDSKELYMNYLKWLAHLMARIHISLDDMIIHFQCTKETLVESLTSDEGEEVSEYIKEGMKYFADTYVETPKEDQISRADSEVMVFLKYLLDFEKEKATEYVLDRIEKGADIKQIYLELIQPALYKIGELWQCQQISVAKEHYCTAVIQHIISLLYPNLFKNKLRKNRTMIAVCAGSELHEIGMRMIADFFELDGWDTFYLGANLPILSILKELKERKVDILAVSTTMGTHIQFVIDLIAQIRAHEEWASLKIIVGGKVFNESKDLWKKVGADGYGCNGVEAVEVGNQLMEE